MRIPVFKALKIESQKEELTHSGALAGVIPWTEESGRLWSTASPRVRRS